MRQVAKKSVFSAVGAAALLGAFALAGCSDDEKPANEAVDAGPQCPSTFALANGKECIGATLECLYAVQCNPAVQQAVCKCVNNTFACEDPNGPVAVGAEPSCSTRPRPPSDNCPANRAAAEGTACRSAGQQCFYQGQTCPGTAVVASDVCQCLATPEDSTKFAFRCESGTCTQQ